MSSVSKQAPSKPRAALLLLFLFLGPGLSFAQCVPQGSHFVALRAEAGTYGPDPVRLSFTEIDGATAYSLDTGVRNLSQAIVDVDIATGEISYLSFSGDLDIDFGSAATASGAWHDYICFDLPEGTSEADVQVVLDVSGTVSCAEGGFSCLAPGGAYTTFLNFNGPVSSQNVAVLIQDLELPVDQLVIDATVVEGADYYLNVQTSVSTRGQGIVDFSNTLALSLNLPAGVSFQSSSGVLLSNIDSDGDGDPDSTDSDDDNDGIADALDTKPLVANNDCTTNDGTNATLVSAQVMDDQTCAAKESVDVNGDNGALNTVVFGTEGNLRVISEKVIFKDTQVEMDGRLEVINADPCPGCSPLPPSFAIGDTGPAGGLVFHVIDGGQHGLEAATVDLGPAEWGCEGTDLVSAGGTAVGTGSLNTAAILLGCSTPGIAARVADNYLLDGYDDWFLPSRFELDLIYLNLKLAGLGNLVGLYWSSSQVDADNAGAVDLDDGEAAVGPKSSPLRLRPIRAF